MMLRLMKTRNYLKDCPGLKSFGLCQADLQGVMTPGPSSMTFKLFD
jgi:hypothetical protein